MRYLIVLGLALAFPLAANAQLRDRITVEEVSVGFPSGREKSSRYKTGAWAPVYVKLNPLADIPAGQATLLVETTDSDGVQNQYATPLPALMKDQGVKTFISYVRPGNTGSEITLTVRHGTRTSKPIKVPRELDEFVQPGQFLFLVMGSRLPALQQAVMPPKEGQPGQPIGDGDPFGEESRARRFALVDQVDLLPTRWFGYQAVDTIVLPTRNDEFIKSLLTERRGVREALAEWVRRGGQLILAAGHNQQFVQELLGDMKVINCTLTGSVRRGELPALQKLVEKTNAVLGAQGNKDGIEVAKLTVGPGVSVLESQPADATDKEDRPLIVQSACGLGRVILVAFDIDDAPFTGWNGRLEFWTWLTDKFLPRQINTNQNVRVAGRWSSDESGRSAPELATQMQNRLEEFGDITVISFGWVALFILLYILVVGPLDYLFLKKVVKRLELTWITFPAVVLIVSAAAYFTAYYLKGNDLKINKVDVLDIDLHPPIDPGKPPPMAYGTTWFTLFSPRIQHYTIGIEPTSPGWGPAPRDGDAGALVGWMGRPENIFGGTGRSGSAGLFRRAYDYTEDASGLEGVPIQVWATKSFSASWQVPYVAEGLPFTASLSHARADPRSVVGTITNRLAVELEDVALFYRGRYSKVGRLAPGEQVRVEADGLELGVRGEPLASWFQTSWRSPAQPQSSRGNPAGQLGTDPLAGFMKQVLFHKEEKQEQLRNTALRPLDQSWRLTSDNADEVILVGRVAPQTGVGSAEKITQDGVAPSRLWLGDLPGPGKTRPPLMGTITQSTYVRVYIPVQ